MSLQSFENLGREMRDSILRLLRDYSEALFLAIVMALILRLFVFSAYKISNPTMEPNLKLGDFIVGYKLPYGFDVPFSDRHIGRAQPRRGEVVIFKCPRNLTQVCVKRIVGLPGDRVEIRGKRLVINGQMAKYELSQELPSKVLIQQRRLVVLREKFAGVKARSIIISDSKELSDFSPYIVPPDSFFALGDNRDFSEDSRHWGAVPLKSIESRAAMVWLSIEWQKQPSGAYTSGLRWSRIFKTF
jgi:signal peptidase I